MTFVAEASGAAAAATTAATAAAGSADAVAAERAAAAAATAGATASAPISGSRNSRNHSSSNPSSTAGSKAAAAVVTTPAEASPAVASRFPSSYSSFSSSSFSSSSFSFSSFHLPPRMSLAPHRPAPSLAGSLSNVPFVVPSSYLPNASAQPPMPQPPLFPSLTASTLSAPSPSFALPSNLKVSPASVPLTSSAPAGVSSGASKRRRKQAAPASSDGSLDRASSGTQPFRRAALTNDSAAGKERDPSSSVVQNARSMNHVESTRSSSGPSPPEIAAHSVGAEIALAPSSVASELDFSRSMKVATPNSPRSNGRTDVSDQPSLRTLELARTGLVKPEFSDSSNLSSYSAWSASVAAGFPSRTVSLAQPSSVLDYGSSSSQISLNTHTEDLNIFPTALHTAKPPISPSSKADLSHSPLPSSSGSTSSKAFSAVTRLRSSSDPVNSNIPDGAANPSTEKGGPSPDIIALFSTLSVDSDNMYSGLPSNPTHAPSPPTSISRSRTDSTLLRPGAPLNEERKLIESYFSIRSTVVDIIHKRTYLQSYRNTSAFFRLTVCATGAVFGVNSFLAKPEAYWYYDQARKCIHTTLDAPCVESVQALILLGFISSSIGNKFSSWQWIGMACRMAIELKMHIDPDELPPGTPYTSNWIEKETRRRVWWCCFNVERTLGVIFSKRPWIRRDQSTVKPLGGEDLWLHVGDQASVEPFASNNQPDNMVNYFNRLVEIWFDVSESLRFHTKNREGEDELLYAALEYWRESIPEKHWVVLTEDWILEVVANDVAGMHRNIGMYGSYLGVRCLLMLRPSVSYLSSVIAGLRALERPPSRTHSASPPIPNVPFASKSTASNQSSISLDKAELERCSLVFGKAMETVREMVRLFDLLKRNGANFLSFHTMFLYAVCQGCILALLTDMAVSRVEAFSNDPSKRNEWMPLSPSTQLLPSRAELAAWLDSFRSVIVTLGATKRVDAVAVNFLDRLRRGEVSVLDEAIREPRSVLPRGMARTGGNNMTGPTGVILSEPGTTALCPGFFSAVEELVDPRTIRVHRSRSSSTSSGHGRGGAAPDQGSAATVETDSAAHGGQVKLSVEELSTLQWSGAVREFALHLKSLVVAMIGDDGSLHYSPSPPPAAEPAPRASSAPSGPPTPPTSYPDSKETCVAAGDRQPLATKTTGTAGTATSFSPTITTIATVPPRRAPARTAGTPPTLSPAPLTPQQPASSIPFSGLGPDLPRPPSARRPTTPTPSMLSNASTSSLSSSATAVPPQTLTSLGLEPLIPFGLQMADVVATVKQPLNPSLRSVVAAAITTAGGVSQESGPVPSEPTESDLAAYWSICEVLEEHGSWIDGP